MRTSEVMVKVFEIMSAPVVSVRSDATVVDAARLLVRHRIAALPVIDSTRRLIGLVSEADLFQARVAEVWREAAKRTGAVEVSPSVPRALVADVMHRDVMWVRHEDPVSLCTQLMTRHNGRSLPVMRHGVVVGIVTRRDVLAALTRPGDSVFADHAHRMTAGTGAIDLRTHGQLEALH